MELYTRRITLYCNDYCASLEEVMKCCETLRKIINKILPVSFNPVYLYINKYFP